MIFLSRLVLAVAAQSLEIARWSYLDKFVIATVSSCPCCLKLN
jgi:hypothetical protein